MKNSKFVVVVAGVSVAGLAFTACGSESVGADSYPSGDVRLVVPYDAGGNVDTQARAFVPCFEEAWDVRVLVENQAGANGALGTSAVVNAEPNGLTLGVSSVAPVVLGPTMLEDIDYQLEDIRPLGVISAAPIFFYTGNESEFSDISEVVEHAQSEALTVSSSGPGSIPGEIIVAFNENYGTDFDIVANDSSSEIIRGVAAGDYDLGMSAAGPEVISRIEGGDIQLLARGGGENYEHFNNVPSFSEAGYDDLLPSTEMTLPLISTSEMSDDIASDIEDTLSTCISDPQVIEGVGAEVIPPEHVSGEVIMEEYRDLADAFN